MHQVVSVRNRLHKGRGYNHIFNLELVQGLLNGVEGERGEHLKVLSFAVDVVEADGHVSPCEGLQGSHRAACREAGKVADLDRLLD